MTEIVKATPRGRERWHSERDKLAQGEAILKDRSYGMSQVELMDKYGLSRNTIKSRIDKAIAARIATTVDHYREQQNTVLDDLVTRQGYALEMAQRMLNLALAQRDLAGIERALGVQGQASERLLKLLERRAKLNGLDRPVQVDLTVTETTQQDQELAAMIREAKAKAANVKAQL